MDNNDNNDNDTDAGAMTIFLQTFTNVRSGELNSDTLYKCEQGCYAMQAKH